MSASALAACGGDGGPPPTNGPNPTPTPTPPPVVVKPESDAEAARFLLQATLAASTDTVAAVREAGYESWLNAEMRKTVPLTAVDWLKRGGHDEVTSNGSWRLVIFGTYAAWAMTLREGNSLRTRLTLALSEFFVIGASTLGNGNWRAFEVANYWDILARNAYGNFRDLLEDVTLNVVMGRFLNMLGNRKGDPASGRVPDENYSREIMQLFSIGLYELNLDGTRKRDGAGNPIETYDNDDVTGLARAFTGYFQDFSENEDVVYSDDPTRTTFSLDTALKPMTADPEKFNNRRRGDQHSALEKSFLGQTIPANTGAQETLTIALDTIFNHPNVAPFFAQQMIQRLVTSNPSPAYVRRVAQVFENNGSGTRGDLRATFKAILLDDEARSATGLASLTFGKMREPMLRFAQWARTFNSDSATGRYNLRDMDNPVTGLGQAPLNAPSVFNFFRPGFSPGNSQASANGLVAPEFQLLNEITVAGYVNTMQEIIDGTHRQAREIKPDYAEILPIAHDAQALVDWLDLMFTANQLDAATKSTIRDALADIAVTQSSPDDQKIERIKLATLLVMASPEYLIQK